MTVYCLGTLKKKILRSLEHSLTLEGSMFSFVPGRSGVSPSDALPQAFFFQHIIQLTLPYIPLYPSLFSPSHSFGMGDEDIYFAEDSCTGNESSLLECRHERHHPRNCDHSSDVGLVCGKSGIFQRCIGVVSSKFLKL